MTKEIRKLDLLRDCNEHGEPPNQFKAMFCQRCRNAQCVNAGWSESRWANRINTQVSRLLENPTFADLRDPQYKPFQSLDFKEIGEPLVLNGSGTDPWEPRVHLATPNREERQYPEVERAVEALRGNTPKKVVEPQTSVLEVQTVAQPVLVSPVSTSTPPVRENPRHYTFDTNKSSPPTRDVNTDFPSDGVMIDGSPPPQPVELSSEDPWTPSSVQAPMKVAVGARVKMGGGGPQK